MEKLFSYGTLQLPQVQQAIFARLLIGSAELLRGYRIENLKIKDVSVINKSGTDLHPILIYTGNPTDEVTGMAFEVTSEELQKADEYEVDEYKRVSAKMQSGVRAWIYSSSDQ